MSFFLLDRDRADGSLRILSSAVYDTRDEAMAALSTLAASGATTADHDVFIADLAAATPVLLVPQATAPLAESASAWEAPAEESPEADATAVEAPSADEGEGLAGALRRAATSLESEGIVAPESVPPAEEVASVGEPLAPDADEPLAFVAGSNVEAPGDTDDDSAQSTDDLAAAIASLGAEAPAAEPAEPAETDVAEPMGVTEPELVTEPEGAPDGGWPWANVEPVTPEEPSLEMAEADAEPVDAGPGVEADESVVEPDAQPVVEDDSMIRGTSIGEDEFVAPKAVIMGDYGADEPSSATPPGYEGGDVQLSDYTCEDCVYANTCPKAGESTPAECGSFQWKSV